MFKFLHETWLMLLRNITITRRNPQWVFIGMFQPVLYLVLFAPLLDNLTMPGYETTNALNVFAPGLLVMTALFGAGFAGFNIIEDLRNGVIERLRVTPASRLALLLGMILRDVLVFILQCVTLLVTAIVMGLNTDMPGLLVLFGMMTLLGLMMASFSYALAMLVKDEGGLAGVLSTITLPLMLLSGVMLPLSLAPAWIQTLGDLNPFSHTVDASRALINGRLEDSAVVLSLSILSTVTVVVLYWATRIFRRATA